jgi:adenosylhomocysteine nucleosidase
MIAITFALPAESADFRRLLAGRRDVLHDGVKIIHGKWHGKAVALFHTGVGRKICEQRVNAFLRAQPLSCLVSTGFAGGLSDTLSVGELLVAENFSSPDVLEHARKLLARHHARFGKLHTAATMIDGAGQRAALADETGAVAVDMETEFIARECARVRVPFLSLRAISDTPLQSFPAPPAVLFDLERQKTRFALLAFYLLRHPISAVRMMEFAQRISRTRRALTSALDELLRSELF